MDKLSTIWFLEHPIDAEYKTYVLLNHLKKYRKKFEKNQIEEALKDVFKHIKNLNNYKKTGEICEDSYLELTEKEKVQISKLEKDFSEQEKIDLECVIDSGLDILYRYASLGLNLIQQTQTRIKAFEIIPPGGHKILPETGFLFIRNLVTDEISAYLWAESKIDSYKSSGVLMKKISLNYPIIFSASYVHIAHEIIKETGVLNKKETPRIFVCEIEEDFSEDSRILQRAKEKFLEKIESEKGIEGN